MMRYPPEIKELLPQIVAVAQAEYDQWEQDPEEGDPELGFGGICDLIADGIAGLFDEAATVNSEGMGVNHTWVVIKLPSGVWNIDIPPSTYESGAGYTWTKKRDVVISPEDVIVELIDPNPDNFDQYVPA